MTIEIFNDDCWEHIKTMSDNSVDAIVTDPPYDIGFMNKGWDKNSIVTKTDFWKECLRVLKPGGHLLAFSHSRTSHRQTSAIEDAGFEIRDTVMWLYGQGFPKSYNVGKAIDKKRGSERQILGTKADFSIDGSKRDSKKHRAVGEKAKEIQHQYGYKAGWDATVDVGNSEWEGWGTALKPAYEPVVMARKPLEGTIADNVEKYGTGAINIDACRIETTDNISTHSNGKKNTGDNGIYGKYNKVEAGQTESQKLGRFPANVIIDEEAGKILDEQTGVKKASFVRNRTDGARPFGNEGKETNYTSEKIEIEEDGKGASRFFYCPKVSTKERNAGCKEIYNENGEKGAGLSRVCATCGAKQLKPQDCKCTEKNWILPAKFGNNHPTVKPIALMEYLIKLVSREGSTILDPFMGSGSTGIACKNLNRNFIGIEKEKEYFQISQARLDTTEDQ